MHRTDFINTTLACNDNQSKAHKVTLSASVHFSGLFYDGSFIRQILDKI